METRKNKENKDGSSRSRTPAASKPPKAQSSSEADLGSIDLENPSSVPPPGVDPIIYGLLLQINTTTKSTETKVDELKDNYDDLNAKYESLESRCSDNQDSITALQKEMCDVKYKLNVLQGRLIRSEAEKKRLSNDLESVTAKSMSKNLIINVKGDKYKEKKQEKTLSVVNTFLKKELKMTDSVNITAAHRTGAQRQDGCRPIIITVPSAMDISKIMSHVKNLKDTGCFIDKQIPQSMSERKRMCLPEFKAAKASGKKAVLRNDKLFVNNQLVRQHLPPTLPNSIEVPSEELEISKGDHIDDSGSRFSGFARKVSCLGDVREVIDTLLLEPHIALSTHVMYAYRIDNGDSVIENFESDGDYGVGYNMLQFLKEENIINSVVVVTRDCGPDFQHIGGKRMKHAVAVCKSALGLDLDDTLNTET